MFSTPVRPAASRFGRADSDEVVDVAARGHELVSANDVDGLVTVDAGGVAVVREA